MGLIGVKLKRKILQFFTLLFCSICVQAPLASLLLLLLL